MRTSVSAIHGPFVEVVVDERSKLVHVIASVFDDALVAVLQQVVQQTQGLASTVQGHCAGGGRMFVDGTLNTFLQLEVVSRVDQIAFMITEYFSLVGREAVTMQRNTHRGADHAPTGLVRGGRTNGRYLERSDSRETTRRPSFRQTWPRTVVSQGPCHEL
jgi:hypothetical protein